jgi:hypothetical protein
VREIVTELVPSGVIEAVSDRLDGFELAKGTIRFTQWRI